MEFDDSRMFAMNDFKGATWLAKRLGNYAAFGSSNTSTYSVQGLENYPCCLIQVLGPTSTASVLLIEVCINIEANPVADTTGALLAQKGVPRNDAVITAASVVQNKVPGTFLSDVETAGKTIESIVSKSPLGIIANMGESILNMI
jgi:hypothetical protein